MSEVFKAKLRRIGNSTGIIIPNEILTDLGYEQGDSVQVVIPSMDIKKRNKRILKMAGKYKGKTAFKREKEDRF